MKYKVSFFFAWYDFWIGGFYDQKKGILYVCPLPCCVFKFERNLTQRAVDVGGQRSKSDIHSHPRN
jgi:hypothetical protein